MKIRKKPRIFYRPKIQFLSHGTPEKFVCAEIVYHIFSSYLGLSKKLFVFGQVGFSGVLVQLRTSRAQNLLLWYKVKKSKCWPPKWIFRGKWCSTKLFPIKFHGEMTPRGRNLASRKKVMTTFWSFYANFLDFWPKIDFLTPYKECSTSSAL